MKGIMREEVLDMLDEIGISFAEKSYYRVWCENCTIEHERWTRPEAQAIAKVHHENNEDHEVVFQKMVLIDSNHPQLGFSNTPGHEITHEYGGTTGIDCPNVEMDTADSLKYCGYCGEQLEWD